MSESVFHVETPGLLTTVQDAGRLGRLADGMPPAGPMDPFAFAVANLLVGNARGDAGLEITWSGPTLRALRSTVAAVCGADLSATLDGVSFPRWRAMSIQTGQTLAFGRRKTGARAYLAVAGGFDVPLVLNSRATFLRAASGGLEGRALRAGDMLAAFTPHRPTRAGRRLAPSAVPPDAPVSVVRVLPGPHAALFAPDALTAFFSSTYMVSPAADRMGCRLSGPPVSPVPPDLLSEPTAPGSVQIPPDGLPIVLLADRQTTGGYAQIAVVITADLPRLGQLWVGDSVSFQSVSLDEAQALLRAQEHLLHLLAQVCIS